jgi:hypothetical protein
MGKASAKVRRETDTAVKSPDVLKKTVNLKDGPDKRPSAKTVTTSHPLPGAAASPFDSSSVAPSDASISSTPPSDLPDKTAALPSIPDSGEPSDSEADVRAASVAALDSAGLKPRRYTSDRPATAEALHEEDEDGPTMVAPIPPEVSGQPSQAPPPRPGPPPQDDEATAVHPGRLPPQPVTQPPPPMHTSSPVSVPVSSSTPISIQPRDLAHAAPPPILDEAPQDAPPSGRPSSAIQAAIDAAAMMPIEAKLLAERKARTYDTFAASILGVGMITSALACYLAAGVPEKTSGYFGVVALAAVAMFLVGMGPMQQRNETKVTFIALGGVMLAFTLISLLIVAV